MAILLDLQPDVERELAAQAEARGLSLEAFAGRLLEEEARRAGNHSGKSIVEASRMVRGLLTNEEADALFVRPKDTRRPVSFE